jgi:signal transduction histidine kinase
MQVTNLDNRLRLVSDSEAHLRSLIATLEENRAVLIESANAEAAQILAVAILQLRMRLHRIADSELKDLCQAVLVQEAGRSKKSEDAAAKGLAAKGLAGKETHFTGRDSRWPNSIK